MSQKNFRKRKNEARWYEEVLKKKLLESGNVETNPGPRNAEPETKLKIVTQNCRGIADEKKFKHLINSCYKVGKGTENFIIALQETMIKNDQKLTYGWRGTHIFTPGSGHGRGCVTLLPSHRQPDANSIVQLGQRGHIFKAAMGQDTIIVANIYAPNGQTREKITFFEQVRQEIANIRDPSDDVYLMGDFNTVFASHELRSRSYSDQEQRHSTQVKQIIDSLALEDAWQNNKTTHTWRQAGTLKTSRLDRIYFQSNLKQKDITVDWTFTNSDHGAVMVAFTDGNSHPKEQILRLNPEILKEPELRKNFLKDYTDQIQQIPDAWDPHKKLEFHKCAIRSAYVQVTTEAKKRRKRDYDFVKEDLHTHIRMLEEDQIDNLRKNRVMNKINQLKAEIARMNLLRGQKLADQLKTKWYNEGERSNKYFLALLRRKEAQGQLRELEINNIVEKNEGEIEKHVISFYTELYNKNFEQSSSDEKVQLLRLLEPLNDDEKAKINQPLSLEVLKRTLNSTSDSCPGPDGIPYSYLKVTWSWYGPALLKSWEHSLQTKNLPDSHKASWLRLIPKAGKNSKELKNWRPITLSNCDHKIITKALSTVLAANLNRIISGNQTAYMRERSISDNLRIVALANKMVKQDKGMKGLLIALDAQKAFDSVSHEYIVQVLKKIGLDDYVTIFETLYKGNQVDIMINGKICKGYTIKNGVKQGDALSCTLFILAMEPLIKNIEANSSVGRLVSRKYDLTFPKCIGYADDINILTDDSVNSLRAAIKEYERFSKVSGLQLNADKTEIFKITNTNTISQYTFSYRGLQTVVTNKETIKINGITFAADFDETYRINLENVKTKMNEQFTAWSYRGLTLLGKILIYKTFWLSQIIYTSRVLRFNEKDNKALRAIIYKFLWNRNYQANKAPDRIKRTHMLASIKKGGFGMVDHEEVIKAMNARQLLVNKTGQHPIKEMIEKLMINPESHFNAKVKDQLDGPTTNYTEVLNAINSRLLTRDLAYLQQDMIAKDKMMSEKLRNIVRRDRQNSIEMVMLRGRGITNIRELLADQAMANHFRLRLLHFSYATIMDACLTSQMQNPVQGTYIPIGNRYKMGGQVSSRELRQEFLRDRENERITFKVDTQRESIESFLIKTRKLKCVKAKNLALRLIHGDIFTGIKLQQLALADSNECTKCRQPETLTHLLKDCWYSGTVWSKIEALYHKTDTRRLRYDKNSLNFSMGALVSAPKFKLHLEIIRRLTNKDRPNTLPRTLIKQALDYLIICDLEHRMYYKKLKVALESST